MSETDAAGIQGKAPVLMRCNDSAYAERVRLHRAAQEILSIVETADFDPEGLKWRRGKVSVGISGPTFTMTGSRHALDSQRMVFQVTVPRLPDPDEDAWAKAMDLAGVLTEALGRLRTQNERDSCEGIPAPIDRIRAAMIGASSMKDFRFYDLIVMPRCGIRGHAASTYHDGPEAWTLHPDVERALFEGVPEIIMIDHTAGVDMTIVNAWEHEEEPDEDPMEILRCMTASGLTERELELRTTWPETDDGEKS
jgi:hypothetical protein